jgi:hypothetical protein
MYALLAVEHRGGRAHRIEWQMDPSGGVDFSQLRAMVNAQVASLVDEVTAATGTPPVIIGKVTTAVEAFIDQAVWPQDAKMARGA